MPLRTSEFRAESVTIDHKDNSGYSTYIVQGWFGEVRVAIKVYAEDNNIEKYLAAILRNDSQAQLSPPERKNGPIAAPSSYVRVKNEDDTTLCYIRVPAGYVNTNYHATLIEYPNDEFIEIQTRGDAPFHKSMLFTPDLSARASCDCVLKRPIPESYVCWCIMGVANQKTVDVYVVASKERIGLYLECLKRQGYYLK